MTNWGAPLQTNLTSAIYADTNVAVGDRYEYKIVRPRPTGEKLLLSAAIRATPIESRGKIVILVDSALASRFSEPINAALAQFEEDLVGDGWMVTRKIVPRHDDRANDAANKFNKASVTAIHRLLQAEHQSGAKGVVLVGHVAVPYAGYYSGDGHADHIGAWPADMYYGDVDGRWEDGGQALPNAAHPELSNVPGDGKFENDFAPSDLEMLLGRVDFARLPLFGTQNAPTAAEARLIEQYFAKAHRYRFNLAPYPLGEEGVAYGFFSPDGRGSVDTIAYENAQRNFCAFYTRGLDALKVGDPYCPGEKSWVWGFIVGPGGAYLININMWVLEHTTASLTHLQNEPHVAFHLLLGSYFGDWNSTNNFMRATLATPNYGLAAAWMSPGPTPTHWRFQSMGLGEPLGAGLLSTVNDNPRQMTGDNVRFLAILGDPTLRLHVITPPSQLTVSRGNAGIELTWRPGDSAAQYFVYRAPDKSGPFSRISPVPIDRASFTDKEPSSREPVYMVRAVKLALSGCGSYTNLSQGIFAMRK